MRGRFNHRQGGSLAGFIIVGVLLALVLVGGLYGLNRYNAERQAGEEVASDQSDQEAKSETDAKKQTEQKSESQDDKKAESAPGTTTQGSSQPAVSGSSSTNLPATGPADTALNIIAVSLLGFAGTHYVRSRRSVR